MTRIHNTRFGKVCRQLTPTDEYLTVTRHDTWGADDKVKILRLQRHAYAVNGIARYSKSERRIRTDGRGGRVMTSRPREDITVKEIIALDLLPILVILHGHAAILNDWVAVFISQPP